MIKHTYSVISLTKILKDDLKFVTDNICLCIHISVKMLLFKVGKMAHFLFQVTSKRGIVRIIPDLNKSENFLKTLVTNYCFSEREVMLILHHIMADEFMY